LGFNKGMTLLKISARDWVLHTLSTRWTHEPIIEIPNEDVVFETEIVRLCMANNVDGIVSAILNEKDGHNSNVKRWISIARSIKSKKAYQEADQVRKILSVFHKQEIPTILLKGWSFVPLLYNDDPATRFSVDVDILVNPDFINKGIKLLEGMGYKAAEREPHPGYNFRYGYGCSYVKREWVTIGLHSGLLPLKLSNMDLWHEVWERKHSIAFGTETVNVLSPEHNIVYLCGHLALHHQYHPAISRYYDLALLIKTISQIDWNRVINTAQRWGIILALKNVSLELNRLWGKIVPEDVVEQMTHKIGSARDLAIHYWAAEKDHSPFTFIMTCLINQRSAVEKIRFIAETTFPSVDYMKERYGGVPRGLIWVRYFERWIQMFKYI